MAVSDQGVNLDRYLLVPRTMVILTRGDSILLLKGSINKRLWSSLYNGIGGHVEQGEGILSAAKRELREETGLDKIDLVLRGIVVVDTQINPGVCVFIFLGEYLEGEIHSSPEGSLEWKDISEINTLPLVPDLPFLIPQVLSHDNKSSIFYAISSYDNDGNISLKFIQ